MSNFSKEGGGLLKENLTKTLLLRYNPQGHGLKYHPDKEKYWFNIYSFSSINHTNKHKKKDDDFNKYMWFPKCKNWQYEDILCNTNILENNQHEDKFYSGRKCFFWEFPTQVSTDTLDTQYDIGSYASVIFS